MLGIGPVGSMGLTMGVDTVMLYELFKSWVRFSVNETFIQPYDGGVVI